MWTEDRQITNDCCYHHPLHFLVFLNHLSRFLQVCEKKKHILDSIWNACWQIKEGGAYLKMRRWFFSCFFFSKSCFFKLWSASMGIRFILSLPQLQSKLFFFNKVGSKNVAAEGGRDWVLSVLSLYQLWHLWGGVGHWLPSWLSGIEPYFYLFIRKQEKGRSMGLDLKMGLI